LPPEEVLRECPALTQGHFHFHPSCPEPEPPPPPRRSFYNADSGHADEPDVPAVLDCSRQSDDFTVPDEAEPPELPREMPTTHGARTREARRTVGGLMPADVEHSLRVQIADGRWEVLTFRTGDVLHVAADLFLGRHHVNGAFHQGLVEKMTQMSNQGTRHASVDIVDLI